MVISHPVVLITDTRPRQFFANESLRENRSAGVSARDVIPLSHARANFSELAEEVKAGAEHVITKNGESYIALIDASRLDHYHQLERERIRLLLIDDASKGLDDVVSGR